MKKGPSAPSVYAIPLSYDSEKREESQSDCFSNYFRANHIAFHLYSLRGAFEANESEAESKAKIYVNAPVPICGKVEGLGGISLQPKSVL